MFKYLIFLRCIFLKRVIYRRFIIGKNFHCGMRVRIWARDKIIIGNNFYIGRDSQIETNCQIGDNVIFGNKVAIVGRYDHHFQQIGTPIRLAPQVRDINYNWKGLNQVTVIEDDVWVGYGSIILSGITIGTGSIIAAGSVVTKNVKPFSIYAGNPARWIRCRFESESDVQKHISLLSAT